jgi:multiple sugar transport system substrate-binding protein
LTRRKIRAALICAPLAASLLLTAFGCNNNAGGGSGGGATGGGDTLQGLNSKAPASSQELTIAWAEWEPAKQLQTLTEEFTKETGIKVTVQQIPWSNFETEVKKTWSAQGDNYDLIVGDSQWLGKGATQGHYVDLTEWSKENVPVADIAPAALKNYGEYDGKLWALPCMSDATVFAYRKDLFEDPANKTAFKAKYGKDLGVPKTWDDFKNVAEFFTKPDGSQYGAALYYSKEYDGATMGFDQVLWSFGGDLSKDGKAEGVVNSPAAVQALEYYVGLKKFTPPGSENYYFSECLRDFQEGKVAMAESWFAFLPDLTSDKNKFKDQTGYFPIPAGPKGQFVSLGGQGISVSQYSKKQDDAKKFLAWFQKEDTQKKWVALGGLTANNKVAATDDFKKATPYNVVFTQSVPHLKDFYNTPEYSELLTVSQTELNAAIAGQKKPKEALDAIAKRHQEILDGAGKS